MSSRAGHRVTARRAWLVALAGGALAAGSASPALGQQQPDKVIDAGSNADQAAQELNEWCADIEKCEWENDKNYTWGFGPAKIIGDTMYNCSTSADGEAEIGTGVTDTRGESTSISESISLEISLGFLDLEKTSAEFTAFSRQSKSFDTTVKVTEATQVQPGYRGWNSAAVRGGTVSGDVRITEGIKLIKVTGIELTFPGFRESVQTQPVAYYSNTTPMTKDESDTHCANVLGDTGSAARAARTAQAGPAGTAQAGPAALKRRFKITVCRSKRDSARSSHRGRRRCSRRTVAGLRPPRTRKATATLTRAGRIYAAETNRRGAIRLTQHRTITPGRYRLIIHSKPKRIIVRHKGKRLHWARHHHITTVPVTIRWSRGL